MYSIKPLLWGETPSKRPHKNLYIAELNHHFSKVHTSSYTSHTRICWRYFNQIFPMSGRLIHWTCCNAPLPPWIDGAPKKNHVNMLWISMDHDFFPISMIPGMISYNFLTIFPWSHHEIPWIPRHGLARLRTRPCRHKTQSPQEMLGRNSDFRGIDFIMLLESYRIF